MHLSIRPKRLTGPRPARLLAVAALMSAILVAGCGGSSPSPTVATVGAASTPASSTVDAGSPTTAGSSTTRSRHATSSGSSATGGYGSGPLAFATCMRANGVPNFPDPSPEGGVALPAGTNPFSPAFMAARAKCQKLTGSGPPSFGSSTHPSAQTLAKLVRIARCMRQHGVPQFPDPRTSVPSDPAGYQEITDFD
ncbi:MAG: hypothetical protein ACLPZR_22645 [Solirubrobacteraceae bacterium]